MDHTNYLSKHQSLNLNLSPAPLLHLDYLEENKPFVQIDHKEDSSILLTESADHDATYFKFQLNDEELNQELVAHSSHLPYP